MYQRAARRRGRDQQLAANVDGVLIVCGLDRPLRAGRVDRVVTLAWDAGAEPALVLAKADLPTSRTSRSAPRPGRTRASTSSPRPWSTAAASTACGPSWPAARFPGSVGLWADHEAVATAFADVDDLPAPERLAGWQAPGREAGADRRARPQRPRGRRRR